MLQEGCISCDTLTGQIIPPGGIVGTNDHWIFFCASRPLLVPGQGFVVLKRHCEELADLTPEEVASLGPMLRQTAQVVAEVIRPSRIHVALYAEGVRHIHWHITPRMAGHPASNIRLTMLLEWHRLLARLGLKRAFDDEAVARVAAQMRSAWPNNKNAHLVYSPPPVIPNVCEESLA